MKSLIITESDKKHILSMYGILNEQNDLYSSIKNRQQGDAFRFWVYNNYPSIDWKRNYDFDKSSEFFHSKQMANVWDYYDSNKKAKLGDLYLKNNSNVGNFNWASSNTGSKPSEIQSSESSSTRYTTPSSVIGAKPLDKGKIYTELGNIIDEDLLQKYPCMPKTNRYGKPIADNVRNEMYYVFSFIKKNNEDIKSAMGVSSDDILYHLFRMAISAMDREGSWQELKTYENNTDTKYIKYHEWYGGVRAVKYFTGKEPSVGPYNMQPSNYREMKGTEKIVGKPESSNLWQSRLVATLAAMEYLYKNYEKAKNKLGYTGPSVDITGNVIPNLFGDFNWDVASSSYVWPENLLYRKYCKTKNMDDTYNTDYAAPCDWPKDTYFPFSSKSEAEAKKRPWAGELKIQRNEVIENYLPKLSWVDSEGTTNYDFVRNDATRTKNASCFK